MNFMYLRDSINSPLVDPGTDRDLEPAIADRELSRFQASILQQDLLLCRVEIATSLFHSA
jgi:hypothetical protein